MGKPDAERDGARVAQLGAHGLVLGARDHRPARDALPRLVVEEADLDRHAPHLEGVGADQRVGDVLLDVRVHPLDHRHDGDEEGDRDDDAEEREEASQLVGADLGERGADDVERVHALL